MELKQMRKRISDLKMMNTALIKANRQHRREARSLITIINYYKKGIKKIADCLCIVYPGLIAEIVEELQNESSKIAK
jgi:hypothetical protein